VVTAAVDQDGGKNAADIRIAVWLRDALASRNRKLGGPPGGQV